jgi:hypothetical protein
MKEQFLSGRDMLFSAFNYGLKIK